MLLGVIIIPPKPLRVCNVEHVRHVVHVIFRTATTSMQRCWSEYYCEYMNVCVDGVVAQW